MTLGVWPASMSKSTPTRPDDAHRTTNVVKPERDPHENDPSAPSRDTTYLTPALERSGTFVDAIVAPVAPPQFSLPHSPVAKANVMVLCPAAVRSLASGIEE